MNNYSFVSFDLDYLANIGIKKYFFGTNQPIDNFIFKLADEKDSILFFYLLLDNYCVMKIKIDMENNYTLNDVKEIILLLESNIVIIRQWRNVR